MNCGTYILCAKHIHELWDIYFMCYAYSWIVVHIFYVLSIFMNCGTCILCAMHTHELWYMYFMRYAYSWIVVHVFYVLCIFMNCGTYILCFSFYWYTSVLPGRWYKINVKENRRDKQEWINQETLLYHLYAVHINETTHIQRLLLL
jgi:hypothetical protein